MCSIYYNVPTFVRKVFDWQNYVGLKEADEQQCYQKYESISVIENVK